MASSNSTPNGTSDVSKDAALLVEFKNGKLLFKQKPTSFDKLSETMQEIVKFRAMLEDRIAKNDIPMDSISDEYMPVIAKLVHESDRTGSALVKQLHKQLVPSEEDISEKESNSSALPFTVLETAIANIASRVNYGLDSANIGGGSVPAALGIWRWEVKAEHRDWLPKAAREKAEARVLEREQAKKDLVALFDALPQAAKDELLSTKGRGRPLKDKGKASSSISAQPEPEASNGVSPQKTPADEEIADEPSSETPIKKSRSKQPEKTIKDKEKLEKKEKEQKAADKARSLMANFFGKPKVAPTASSSTSQSGPSPTVSGTSPSKASIDRAPESTSVQSDFERTFYPFVVKRNVEISPINRFLHEKRQGTVKKHRRRMAGAAVVDDAGVVDKHEEAIVISDDEENLASPEDDIQMSEPPPSPSKLQAMSNLARLHSLLASLTVFPARTHRSLPTRLSFKTHSTHNVRELMVRLTEAEVAGDPSLVRQYTYLLRNRLKIPAKVLIFADDMRPGYYGTHTKSSRVIGPRTPFARDEVALDYGYDSGEEWEGEEDDAGEDVVGDDDEEGGDEDEDDSDADSWLVDDDEVEEVSELPSGSSPPPFGDPSMPPPLPKRKNETEEKKDKRRRVVVPLVPFTKGPCWETVIGHSEYEPFNAYRIQLFNDSPYPLNPFTFVSSAVENFKAFKQAGSSSKLESALPASDPTINDCGPSTSSALSIMPSNILSTSPMTSIMTASAGKQALSKPKTAFPDELLPTLVSKIDALATGSLNAIVDSIYLDLRTQKVKKNAIEAKVREVSEKHKERKVWVVREDVRTLL